MKGKLPRIVNYVKIDGEYKNFEDLSDEMKKEIGTELNKRMLNAIGYEEVKPEETETA